MNCKTSNVVYALACHRCDRTVYVGETERTLKARITEHLRDVRLEKEKPINKHFCGHSEDDVRVAVMKRMPDDSKAHRLLWEERYIRLLGTMVPMGCNVKTNL